MKRWLIRIGLTVALGIVLSGCSLLSKNPPQSIIEAAIAQQVSQTQQALNQQFKASANAPTVTIDRIEVHQRQSAATSSGTRYQVTGTCDLEMIFGDRRIHKTALPFQVILQAEPDSNNWRLIQSESVYSRRQAG